MDDEDENEKGFRLSFFRDGQQECRRICGRVTDAMSLNTLSHFHSNHTVLLLPHHIHMVSYFHIFNLSACKYW